MTIPTNPSENRSFLTNLSDAIVRPHEKASGSYMPAVGRVLVNLCTLPALPAGALGGAIGAGIAKCIGGKDMQKWARTGSMIGTFFGVGMLPVIGFGATALFFSIKSWMAEKNPNNVDIQKTSGVTYEKVWKNSIAILHGLFPKASTNVTPAEVPSMTPAEIKSGISALNSISATLIQSEKGKSEIETRQRVVIDTTKTGAAQYTVQPRGSTQAENSLELTLTTISKNLDRAHNSINFVLNSENVDYEVRDLETLKQSVKQIQSWSENSIASEKIKGAKRVKLLATVSEIAQKGTEVNSLIDSLVLKRITQLGEGKIDNKGLSEVLIEGARGMSESIRTAHDEFHNIESPSLEQFVEYSSNATRSLELFEREAQKVAEHLKEIRAFIVASDDKPSKRDQAVSVTIHGQAATGLELKEYVDHKKEEVLQSKLSNPQVLSEEERLLGTIQTTGTPKNLREMKNDFLTQRYGVEDVKIRLNTKGQEEVAAIIDPLFSNDSEFFQEITKLQAFLDGFTDTINYVYRSVASDIQNTLYPVGPNPDEPSVDRTQNPTVGARIEVFASKLPPIVRTLESLIEQQKAKPDPKFKEKIALSIQNLSEITNSINATLKSVGNPEIALRRNKADLATRTTEIEKLQSDITRLGDIEKKPLITALNVINFLRNRKIDNLMVEFTPDIDTMRNSHDFLRSHPNFDQLENVDKLLLLTQFKRDKLRTLESGLISVRERIANNEADVESYPTAQKLQSNTEAQLLLLQEQLIQLGFEEISQLLTPAQAAPSQSVGASLGYEFNNPLLKKVIRVQPKDVEVVEGRLNRYLSKLDALRKTCNKIGRYLGELREVGDQGGWSPYLQAHFKQVQSDFNSQLDSAFKTELNIDKEVRRNATP